MWELVEENSPYCPLYNQGSVPSAAASSSFGLSPITIAILGGLVVVGALTVDGIRKGGK